MKAPGNFATFKWETIGDLIVAFSTAGPVQDEVLAAHHKEMRDRGVQKYLGTAVGGLELNSIQRKASSEAVKNMLVAVVTDQFMVRGLVTAASWLGVNIKAFPWSELNKALDHLHLNPIVAQRALETISRWKAEFLV